MARRPYSRYLKTAAKALLQDEALRSPVTVLNGIGEQTARVLSRLDVYTVFDLAHSRIFANARALAFPAAGAVFRETQLVAADVVDSRRLLEAHADDWSLAPIAHLQGIGPRNQQAVIEALHAETVRDLALWPPYLAARAVAGITDDSGDSFEDEGIPSELVPRFNEHASEKSFFSVYVVDAAPGRRALELTAAVSLHDPALVEPAEVPRTGAILRYEQSWTPVALTLGNLLHSLALAPGESTRIAMIDWSRRQGVRTTEDISQLEALSNSLMQTRSISEVTRAVAREAQQGFSEMNSNSTVANTAYSTYGVQNMEQALAAGTAGASAGGAAGAVGGGVAGAGIGVVAGGVSGGFGAGVGAIPGMIIGGIAGAAIGAGAGGLVGATTGGVGAFLGTAEFGSGQGSGSTTTVDAVTTTSSTGTRDVAAEMAQNIDDRTHQHASTSRNRHAAIVQEVSQQETEQISTRVVTNYNHMHALTIQYFEVVQVYNVRTTLVQKQDCLYIPFLPVRWTPELIALCRPILLRAALNAEVLYTLLTSEKKVSLGSPTYRRFPAERRAASLETAQNSLRDARTMLDAFVSGDPFDGWRVPDHLRLVWVWHAFSWGPFFTQVSEAGKRIDYRLVIRYRDGRSRTVESDDALTKLPADARAIGAISQITLRLTSADFDFATALEQPWVGSMGFTLTDRPDGENWEERHASLTFRSHYVIERQHLAGNTVELPILVVNRALAMSAVVEHLNEHSDHYTREVLRTKGSPLVRRVLGHYGIDGKPLLNLVDQEPVAVTGASLAFLLHEPIGGNGRDSARYRVGEITRSSLVPVGTGGVFAEAIQGRANAAEKLDVTRFWNWQESPIPIVAPEIAPLQAGSRAMATDVRPGSLDAPVVQMMSPQALPTPQGLPAVLQAVSTQMFRDMSGVVQTAQLAQRSIEQAMEGATTTGAQSSANLAQGLGLTKELLGKLVDMNSQFASTLAQSGFGMMGMAMGGSGGGAGGAGGLVNKGPSQIGALMNAAAKLDAQAGGRGGGANAGALISAAGAETPPSTGGGTIAGGTSGGGNTASAPPVAPASLQQQVLESAAGLPAGGGAGSASPFPVGGAQPAPASSSGTPVVQSEALARLRQLLPQAAQSDEGYDAAVLAMIRAVEETVTGSDNPWPIYELATPVLAEAWQRAVDRAVADVNGGQLARLDRIDRLLADAAMLPPLRITTTHAEIMARIAISLAFAEVQAPDFSPGGTVLAITGRLVQTLPGGQPTPVANAEVRLTAAASQEEQLTTSTAADGRFAFSVTQGVPDPGFAGITRFTGLHDVEIFLSAISPLSLLVQAEHRLTIRGLLAVRLESAIYTDDLSDARSHPLNNIVLAAGGRKLWLHFLVTKGGQPLHMLPLDRPPMLNGPGLVEQHSTNTMHDGRISVIYDPLGTHSGTGYLAVEASSADGQGAAARADLQFS